MPQRHVYVPLFWKQTTAPQNSLWLSKINEIQLMEELLDWHCLLVSISELCGSLLSIADTATLFALPPDGYCKSNSQFSCKLFLISILKFEDQILPIFFCCLSWEFFLSNPLCLSLLNSISASCLMSCSFQQLQQSFRYWSLSYWPDSQCIALDPKRCYVSE